MEMSVDKIYQPVRTEEHHQPLFIADVPAGFPSPAADYEQAPLDLNRYLVKNPPATFFVRAAGDSMTGAGIRCGDILVVDRSIEPADKKIVIAVVNGEFTVKRIRIGTGKIILEAENENYQSQQITADMEFEVWGVVTAVLHKL